MPILETFLSWAFEYTADKVADSALADDHNTRKRLDRSMQDWLNALPPDLALTHLDPLLSPPPDRSSPEMRALAQALRQEKLPSVDELHAALLKQWETSGAALGRSRQAFFAADRVRVSPELRRLAQALVQCLEVDQHFFMREMLRRSAQTPQGGGQYVHNEGAQIGTQVNVTGGGTFYFGTPPKG